MKLLTKAGTGVAITIGAFIGYRLYLRNKYEKYLMGEYLKLPQVMGPALVAAGGKPCGDAPADALEINKAVGKIVSTLVPLLSWRTPPPGLFHLYVQQRAAAHGIAIPDGPWEWKGLIARAWDGVGSLFAANTGAFAPPVMAPASRPNITLIRNGE